MIRDLKIQLTFQSGWLIKMTDVYKLNQAVRPAAGTFPDVILLEEQVERL